MSDFEFDCMKKKQLAGQAKYRKRGSKSKKCSLPSDRMTQKQWKDRCGPVITCSMNKPMIWGDFKKMPAHIQAEYITNLQNKYGVTAVDLGKMFGVQPLTVRKHADANNLGVEFPRGHAMSATRKAEWAKFISEEDDGLDSDISCESIQEVLKQEDEDKDTKEAESSDIVPIEPKTMNMKRFSLQFAGEIDVNMIANSLKLILGNRPTGELEIICNLA